MKLAWEADPCRANNILLSRLRTTEFKVLLQFWDKKDKGLIIQVQMKFGEDSELVGEKVYQIWGLAT